MATITAQLVRLVKRVVLKLYVHPDPTRKRILVAVGVIVVGLLMGHPCLAQVRGQEKAVIDNLLKQLDDNAFKKREQAQKGLNKFIENNELSPDNFKQLRDVTGDGTKYSLEVRRRVEKALQKWTIDFIPELKRLLDMVLTRGGGVRGLFPRTRGITFDGFTGTVVVGNKVFDDLLQKYEAIRNSVASANFDKPITEKAFKDLRDFINQLTPRQIDDLSLLDENGMPATKEQLLGRVDMAINQLNTAFQAIGAGSAQATPAPRPMTKVSLHGMVDLGKSVRLAINTVVSTGELDSFDVDDSLTLYAPPPGYQFVGHVYDLLADDTLKIAGATMVSIEYGEVQMIGNPVRDPARLRIARLANGRVEILDTYDNDLANYIITGYYTPPSDSSGLDQFGEFAVVQLACPAPAALDSDGDGISDACDKCPAIVNSNQGDTDSDSLGNTCDFDLNDDGQVDGSDVSLIVEQQEMCSGDPSFSPTADLDGDGCIDATDLDLLLTQVPVSIDLTCNGQTDTVALALLIAQYGMCLGELDFDPVADLNGDGCVDGIDVRRLCMSTPRISE